MFGSCRGGRIELGPGIAFDPLGEELEGDVAADACHALEGGRARDEAATAASRATVQPGFANTSKPFPTSIWSPE